ncbi:MAG TPA: M67 family metallopeptidase [Candidatus Limnocylindria bacterium]|nr:M67 family metallopeptidase [Candidatus Limnocylindria bacterium]
MSPKPPRADALSLPADVAAALLAHVRAEAPNEACGLLSGDLRRGSVAAFHPVRNALASPYRFDVDPGDLARALDAIEATGLELVAIFHSHPRSAAVPSALDRRESRYPVPYLIAGVEGSSTKLVLRAWRVDEAGAREMAVRIGRDQQSEARLSRTLRATGSSTMSTAHEPSSLPER